MSSVVTVLACVAIPLVFAYENKNRVTGPGGQPSRRQDLHLRRRVQHAASGMCMCLGYKWVITDAQTGEEEGIVAEEHALYCVGDGTTAVGDFSL